jgi:hypothetical protein
MKGEARHSHKFEMDPEELPPETARQQILERENAALRLEVKHLQSALRCAARTLSPYTDRAMKK